ncbi:MAG: hypothetical protein JXR27_04600 [Paludibacteraceae bacterium]|nr:hypothetical protein [Paludibacteraceae bacterium]
MNEVVSDYIYQSKYDLDKLFEWALSDMKLRTEKDKLIVFNFKSTRYDKENDLIKGIGDVEVPGVVNFPNIHVDSRMTKAYLKNNKTRVRIEVMYSDAFLRKTTGVFYAMPENEQNSRISLETKVQFGWFFNIFITQTAFRSIMEWRFHQMMQNIRDEAERRYSLQQSTQKK